MSSRRAERSASASDRSRGFRKRTMKDRLMANRGGGYSSIRDLWLRSGLDKSDIERLADADAFGSIGLSRREALWAVRALDVKRAAERLPLFDQGAHLDLQVEPQAKLPEMLPGEQVIEDYRYLSLSLKAHPVSFLREELRKIGITRNVDLLRVPNGRWVSIAGPRAGASAAGFGERRHLHDAGGRDRRCQRHRLAEDLREVPRHRHGRAPGQDQGQAAKPERRHPYGGRSYRGYDAALGLLKRKRSGSASATGPTRL
jgi:hypothetical protein